MPDFRSRKLNLITLTWAHLSRKRGRTLFLFIAVTAAIASLVAIRTSAESTETYLGKKLDEFGANLIIQPQTSEIPLDYGGVSVSGIGSPLSELTEDDAAALWTIRNKQNLNIVAPKLVGVASTESRRFTLVGANLTDELRLRPWWQLEGAPPSAPDEVMLGASIATALGKNAGEALTINGNPFKVAGKLHPLGGAEDNIVYADLHAVQTLMGKPGKLSVIEVSAWCTDCPIETIEAQVSEKLPHARVSAVKQAIAGKREAVSAIGSLAFALSILILAIVGLLLSTTMMASVSERSREIGVLRAIGFRRSKIMRIIFTEAQLICVPAGILGFVAGTMVAGILIDRILDFQATVAWNPVLAFESVLLAIVIGGAAGIYPAWRAAGLDPASALRSL